MLIRAFDEDGDRFWILDFLNKGVFLFAKLMLIDEASPTEIFWANIINAV